MALLDKEGVIPQHLIEAEERESDEKTSSLDKEVYKKAWLDSKAGGTKTSDADFDKWVGNGNDSETFNYKGHTYSTGFWGGNMSSPGGANYHKRVNERRYYYTDPKDSKRELQKVLGIYIRKMRM